LAACTYLRSWQDLDIVNTVTLPLFLFSGTFFPVSLYPTWLQTAVWISPLYHASALIQACALGDFHWVLIAHAGILLGLLVGGITVAARRFRVILQP
jgi:lipooligosaccharide transport system permease protein